LTGVCSWHRVKEVEGGAAKVGEELEAKGYQTEILSKKNSKQEMAIIRGRGVGCRENEGKEQR